MPVMPCFFQRTSCFVTLDWVVWVSVYLLSWSNYLPSPQSLSLSEYLRRKGLSYVVHGEMALELSAERQTLDLEKAISWVSNKHKYWHTVMELRDCWLILVFHRSSLLTWYHSLMPWLSHQNGCGWRAQGDKLPCMVTNGWPSTLLKSS